MALNIWWIRRDLRLSDNQALEAALDGSSAVLPVFVIDPVLISSPYVGEKRQAFLWASLRHLDDELRQRGSYLVVLRGRPEQQLARLVAETGAQQVLAEEDFSPYARQRDSHVARSAPLRLVQGLTVHHPEAVLTGDGRPYRVYTPYRNAWKARALPSAEDLLPAPEALPTPAGHQHLTIPDEPLLSAAITFTPGEAAGQARLNSFASEGDGLIYAYDDNRNALAEAGTSRLSPYLRFGMVSARQAVVAALSAARRAPAAEQRHQAETWLHELIWREFYQALLYHFPQVRGQNFRPQYDAIKWSDDQTAFAAWREGRTGFPIVDAAMRQLEETGWMPNRARMITASFLVKDLLIDWRWGERWFMQHLVDGDPAANNGGWQWCAGTGADAAPYFRIFNPLTQAKKFDPEGTYVRRWLPALAQVPVKFVHQPHKMPVEVQAAAGCRIGSDYPSPIIDHATARLRALDRYAAARDDAAGG